MFKKLLSLCLVVAIAANFNTASAADKIAIVDVEKIVENSVAAQSLKKKAEEKKEDITKKLKAQEKELEKEKKKLEKQQSILSKDAFKKKYESFREKVIKANKSVKEEGQKLEKAFLNALKQIDQVTMDIVVDIAKKRDYDLVLSRNKVLYYQGGDDITDDVLKKLNKKLPKVKFK